jgi:two-component system cell cycle sensor histidine kinase/response regulator CckA
MSKDTGTKSSSTSIGHVPMDRLGKIFDGMFDGVWLVGADGRTTYANASMAELLGSTPAQMSGRRVTDFLDQESWAAVDGFLDRQQSSSGERIELRLRRTDGSDLFGLVAGSPIITQDGTFAGVVLNFSDVTRKRRVDAQIAQSQRLEAIGEFAGAISHDFNNLLTAIRGFAELVRSGLPADDTLRSDIDQVILSADRASGITRKLLAFTRRQVLEPVVLDPAQVIGDLVPMLRPLVGENIDIILHVQPRHAWVRVDPVQLEQVLVNLTVNARDAMPNGGTLTIELENVEVPPEDAPNLNLPRGTYVRILIRDTGVGMDEPTMARIFDPFFTTKKADKGTGLGLATVYGILAQSGGQISAESVVGHGSTFSIFLPQAAAPVLRGTQPPADEAEVRGAGVVLLVEDEPAVREFARRALVRAGYTVLVAASGDEAIRESESWPGWIDVLLTDVVMSGMHGPAVVERVREQRPGVGVLYTSGYAEDAVSQGGELGTYGAFLPKPFTADAIVRAVQQVVDLGLTTKPLLAKERRAIRRSDTSGTSHA